MNYIIIILSKTLSSVTASNHGWLNFLKIHVSLASPAMVMAVTIAVAIKKNPAKYGEAALLKT